MNNDGNIGTLENDLETLSYVARRLSDIAKGLRNQDDAGMAELTLAVNLANYATNLTWARNSIAKEAGLDDSPSEVEDDV